MSKVLHFDYEHRYEDDDSGIPMSVKLSYGGITIGTTAKVDPGSIVCLFSQEVCFT
ncbi:MAG: hypothetical protein HOP19_01460 [Acidobacteria bacterium]|nr:hypothetical protein [Acidobacteriota bacterium]